MKRKPFTRISLFLLSVMIDISAVFSAAAAIPLQACAAPSSLEELQAEQEARMSLPVQSNQTENWPEGPAIGAEGAILMEAGTGVILYAKNIHEKLYPASTTKLMTCLLAAENSSMDEIVTFSRDAVFSIEPGSSNIGIDAGQAMPMEECLYGILVGSANEVAAAVAEHVAGSQEAFADMMNERAAELGCTDTHFVNSHGLFDEQHYTTASDLALIAKAFFQNELLSKIGNTPSHHFAATADQPDDFTVRNKHQLITGEIPYDGVKGGKTGYTDEARQTLVTCAERNGMKLICVVMKEESPEQFNDTVKLFDYGFNNFTAARVAEHESKYKIDDTVFFHTSYDIFGNSDSILSLNGESYVILPKTVDFEELTSEISYDVSEENQIARIDYYYHGAYVGAASIDQADRERTSYDFIGESPAMENSLPLYTADNQKNIIFINVKLVLLVVLIAAALLIVIFIIRDIATNYAFIPGGRSRKRKKFRSRKKEKRSKGPKFQ